MVKQAHLYIKGDVIGVGFRAWTRMMAKKVGVGGWVRNVYDKPEIFGVHGGVEAVVQGEEEKVKEMIELLKKGPETAHVEEVEVFWEEPKEVFEDFEVRK